MTNALQNLAGDINAEHDKAEAKAQEAIGHALEAGRLLVEAKAQVTHGGWADWLTANFRGSKRTAQAYMRLANNREAIEAKTQRVAHLGVRDALAMLAESKDTAGPRPSWLPESEEVIATLTFDYAVPVVGDHGEVVEHHHPRLFVQRHPKSGGMFNVGDDAFYDVWLLEGMSTQYNSKPSPDWMATYQVMIFAGGRTTDNGKLMEVRKPDGERPRGEVVQMLSGMGWTYEDVSPGFVCSLIDNMRREDIRLRPA